MGREVERIERAVSAFRKARGKERDERQPPAEPAPEPKPAAAKPAPADKPPEPQKPAIDESHYKSQIERLTRGNVENEKRALEAEAKLKELSSKFEGLEKLNPLDLLKQRGTSLEQLVRDAAAGKVKPTTELDLQFEKHTEQARALEKQLQELTAWKAETERRAQAERDLGAVRERMQSRNEALPLSNALSWTAERARDVFYARREAGDEGVDFERVLGDIESAVASDARALMGNEASLKALLADSELRTSVRRVLDALEPKQKQRPTPASSEGDLGGGNSAPTNLREIAAIPGSRAPAIPSAAERVSAARAAVRRHRGG